MIDIPASTPCFYCSVLSSRMNNNDLKESRDWVIDASEECHLACYYVSRRDTDWLRALTDLHTAHSTAVSCRWLIDKSTGPDMTWTLVQNMRLARFIYFFLFLLSFLINQSSSLFLENSC